MLEIIWRCPFAVSIFFIQWRLIRSTVRPGKVAKYFLEMALLHSLMGGARHAKWKKLIRDLTDWTSYALKVCCTLGTDRWGTLGSAAFVDGRGNMYNLVVGC